VPDKNNLEGAERQRRMRHRARELGWPDQQVQTLGGDTGRSGSTQHGRDDYQTMLQAIMDQTAGLLCVRELSRLVRDNQDWNQLVRLCRYQGVLLADEHRVYDPGDPQDRVMLGIQGAFNEFELAMICDRMQKSRTLKAERGELYEGFSAGYICRHPPLYEKHPDLRVQRAVEQIFQEYERAPSVCQLYRSLLGQGYQLPVVPHGKDWREVQWVTPRYQQIVEILRNPAYAGIYARGRRRTVTILDEQGHPQKKRLRVPMDQWDVFLEDHHERYITRATWERNVARIAANACLRRPMNPRSPQNGSGLMAGLLRCRRCGHKLHTTYRAEGASYVCRNGATQRDSGGRACFSFRGARVDRCLTVLLFEALAPAGVAATNEAEKRLAVRYEQQRRLIGDRLEASREIEARAAREYKETDPTYAAVRRRLAAEWDEALGAVRVQEAQLEELDRRQSQIPTAEQISELNRLSEDVQRIWNHPRASMTLKKQIVRTLVHEIVVDIDASGNQVILDVHWAGGHHTQLRVHRRRRKSRQKIEDLKSTVNTLRKVLKDATIASVLNRENVRTFEGKTWTALRVADFRKQHHIPAFSEKTKTSEGWLTQAEAATCLEISPMSVTRLVKAGIIHAEQPQSGLPGVVSSESLQADSIKLAVQALKSSPNRPLSNDPNQLSLFAITEL